MHDRTPRSLGSTPLRLVVTSSLLFLLLQQGAIVHADGEEVFQLTRALAERGSLAIDPNPDFPLPGEDNIGSPGRDGETFSRYGVGLSVLGIVPFLLALPFSELLGHEDLIHELAVASLIPILSALLVGALYALGRRLGASEAASAFVALGAVVGTFLVPYTKEYFSEPVLALFLTLMLERAIARHPAQAALALTAAALVRPQAFAFAPLLVLTMWRFCGWRGAVRASLPIALGVAFSIAYNWLRFDSLLATGYEADEGFNTPLHVGTWGLLTDPQKSLFLFCPVVLLVPLAVRGLWRARPWAAALVIGNFLVTFVVTATWSGWDGDWAWGPRLLIPGLIPLLMVVAPWVDGHARRHRATLALFVVGFALSAAALVVPMQTQQLDEGVLSPDIVRQLELVGPTLDYTADNLAEADSGDPDHRFYLSTWQVLAARRFGLTGFLVALAVTAGLLLALVLSAGRLRRSLRPAAGGRAEPAPVIRRHPDVRA